MYNVIGKITVFIVACGLLLCGYPDHEERKPITIKYTQETRIQIETLVAEETFYEGLLCGQFVRIESVVVSNGHIIALSMPESRKIFNSELICSKYYIDDLLNL
jgi:hypothetical protein